MLQYVAVCYSLWQCVAVCCSVLQYTCTYTRIMIFEKDQRLLDTHIYMFFLRDTHIYMFIYIQFYIYIYDIYTTSIRLFICVSVYIHIYSFLRSVLQCVAVCCIVLQYIYTYDFRERPKTIFETNTYIFIYIYNSTSIYTISIRYVYDSNYVCIYIHI